MSLDKISQYGTNNDDDNNKVNNDLPLKKDKRDLVLIDGVPVYEEREESSPEKKFNEESIESSSSINEIIEHLEDFKNLNKETLENIFYTNDRENSGEIESNEQNENKNQEPNYDITSIRRNLSDKGLSLEQIDSILKAYFNSEGVEKKELIKQAKDTKQLIYLISKLNSIRDYNSENLAEMISYIENIRKDGNFTGITRSEGLRNKVFEIAVNESKNINELNTILKSIPDDKERFSEPLELIETLDNVSNEENLEKHLIVIDKILETEGDDRLKVKVIDLTIKNAIEKSTSQEDLRERLKLIETKIKSINNQLDKFSRDNPELALKYNYRAILSDLEDQIEYKKRNDLSEKLPIQSQGLIIFNQLPDTLFENNIEEISNDYSTQDRNFSSTEQKSNTEILSEEEISEIEQQIKLVTTIEQLRELAKKLEASGIKSSAGGQLFSEDIANAFKDNKYISERNLQYFSSKHGIREAFKKLLKERDKKITEKIATIDNINTLMVTIRSYENNGFKSSNGNLLIPEKLKEKLQNRKSLTEVELNTISNNLGVRDAVIRLQPKNNGFMNRLIGFFNR